MADYMIPTSVKEVKALGWDYIDVIIFSGDAFVDHPSFGTAVIARWLQKYGYRVAVVPQPNWRDDLRDFRKLGLRGFISGLMPGLWIPWSTTIRLPRGCAAMMHIRLTAVLDSVRIMLSLYIRRF